MGTEQTVKQVSDFFKDRRMTDTRTGTGTAPGRTLDAGSGLASAEIPNVRTGTGVVPAKTLDIGTGVEGFGC